MKQVKKLQLAVSHQSSPGGSFVPLSRFGPTAHAFSPPRLNSLVIIMENKGECGKMKGKKVSSTRNHYASAHKSTSGHTLMNMRSRCLGQNGVAATAAVEIAVAFHLGSRVPTYLPFIHFAKLSMKQSSLKFETGESEVLYDDGALYFQQLMNIQYFNNTLENKLSGRGFDHDGYCNIKNCKGVSS